MSRPTVTVISPKGEASNDTIPVPQVFKASLTIFSQVTIEPPPARIASPFDSAHILGQLLEEKSKAIVKDQDRNQNEPSLSEYARRKLDSLSALADFHAEGLLLANASLQSLVSRRALRKAKLRFFRYDMYNC